MDGKSHSHRILFSCDILNVYLFAYLLAGFFQSILLISIPMDIHTVYFVGFFFINISLYLYFNYLTTGLRQFMLKLTYIEFRTTAVTEW